MDVLVKTKPKGKKNLIFLRFMANKVQLIFFLPEESCENCKMQEVKKGEGGKIEGVKQQHQKGKQFVFPILIRDT